MHGATFPGLSVCISLHNPACHSSVLNGYNASSFKKVCSTSSSGLKGLYELADKQAGDSPDRELLEAQYRRKHRATCIICMLHSITNAPNTATSCLQHPDIVISSHSSPIFRRRPSGPCPSEECCLLGRYAVWLIKSRYFGGTCSLHSKQRASVASYC
jgi:hypothetical protein